MQRELTTTFYGLWLRTILKGALDRTALVAFLILSTIEIGKRFIPKMEITLSAWIWIVPFWALLAVVLARLAYAPYQIWRADQQRLATMASDLSAAKEAIRASSDHPETVGLEISESGSALLAGSLISGSDVGLRATGVRDLKMVGNQFIGPGRGADGALRGSAMEIDNPPLASPASPGPEKRD